MRVICTIADRGQAYGFSSYLQSHGINNQCEEVIAHNKSAYRIWVVDEDHLDQAHKLYDQFRDNPTTHVVDEEIPHPEPQEAPMKKPYGLLSKAIIVSTILLFIWSIFHQGITIPPKIPGIVEAPQLKSVVKSLVYDYPAYFEKRDELLQTYTPEMIKQGNLPPQVEIKEIQKISFWNGIYDRFIDHVHHPEIPLSYDGPMFEKISQGEVWRIFTPCLLHYDLLHIFFNLLWFIILGNQIEARIGTLRYAVLILLGAIVPNTAQYLMSGSFFMGLSGVVVALAAFIWARQQVAPWEGYLLQRATLIFLGIFILGIFALQVVFFFMQVFGKMEVNIMIANTAHLMGGSVGYALGRTPFFALKK